MRITWFVLLLYLASFTSPLLMVTAQERDAVIGAQPAPPAPGQTVGSQQGNRYHLEYDVPARNTIVELNPSEGAKNYQLQIRPYYQVWAIPYTFDIDGQDRTLRLRLQPGKYKIRTRSFDGEGFYGPWSDWLTFWINYKPPAEPYPANNAVIKPKSGIKERITFEWPEAPKAKGYWFVLKDGQGNVIKGLKTQNTWSVQEVDLSAEYSWQILPINNKDWAQKQPNPETLAQITPNTFRVQGSQPGTRDVMIQASPTPRAVNYQFEFLKLDAEGERGTASMYETEKNEFPLALAPGTYEMRVRTFFDDRSISDWSPPWQFFVPYEKVKTKTPLNNAVIDPRDDEASPVKLSWEPAIDVNHYVVYIYDDKGRFEKSYKTKDTNVEIQVAHNRGYRWLVIPYSAGQSTIRPPELPDYAPGFSVGKYIPLLLARSEEPSYLYTWGRYYTSYIDYLGKNYDLNSLVKQPIYGGTGELALGYWHRKTQFGILGHAALSGFLLNNITYNYGNAGLHLGYRHISGRGTRIRVWAGISYAEFPELLRDPLTNNIDYHRIKNYGPQLQVSYMDDFNNRPKQGYHIYGVVYQSMGDVETPNGLAQIPELNYTVGAFYTHKWSRDQKWQVGYAYRREAVRYTSNDRSGKDNFSTTTGHYLNLSIEFSLTKDYYK